jgi:ketosteroid isomerase-like protein
VKATDAGALVDSVERFLDAIERGDVEAAIEVVTLLVHPQMQFTSVIGSEIEGRTYIGLDGLREWFQDYTDTFEARYEDRRIRALSEEVFVGLFTNKLRGKGSDVEIAREIGTVWELRDGQVVRAVTYASPEQALQAAEAALA